MTSSPASPDSPHDAPGADPGAVAAAARLRSLHLPGRPLVLPNAWDVGSARWVEAAGFPVVATSSAAVAAVHGQADDDCMPVDVAFGAVAAIAAAVGVPVTADIEAGYRLPAGELVARLVGDGAVGCNLEDTDHHGPSAGAALVPAERQAERLAEVRAAATRLGVPVVVNARIDVWVRSAAGFGGSLRGGSGTGGGGSGGSSGRAGGGPAGEDLDARRAESVRRARLYLDAGADCVYPIGLADERQIGLLVEELDAPVNIWWRPGGVPIERLAALGVARISLGSGLYRAAESAARAFLADLAPRATLPAGP